MILPYSLKISLIWRWYEAKLLRILKYVGKKIDNVYVLWTFSISKTFFTVILLGRIQSSPNNVYADDLLSFVPTHCGTWMSSKVKVMFKVQKNVFKTINSQTNKQSAHVLNSKWTVRISWVRRPLSASSWIEINKFSRRNVETMRKISIIADNGLVGSCGHTLIVPMRASTLYYLRWIVINCIELYSMRNEKKIIVIVLLTIKIWAQPSRWCLLLDFIAVYTDIRSGMLLNIFLSTTTTTTTTSLSSFW